MDWMEQEKERGIIEVDGEQITAEKFYRRRFTRPPTIAGLAGTPYMMTSTEALRNLELPKRLIVLGAGYVPSNSATPIERWEAGPFSGAQPFPA